MDLTELKGELIGVAVKHREYETGEIRDVRNYKSEVYVEFGKAGVDEWISVENLRVDVEYYDKNPEHAVKSVQDALGI